MVGLRARLQLQGSRASDGPHPRRARGLAVCSAREPGAHRPCRSHHRRAGTLRHERGRTHAARLARSQRGARRECSARARQARLPAQAARRRLDRRPAGRSDPPGAAGGLLRCSRSAGSLGLANRYRRACTRSRSRRSAGLAVDARLRSARWVVRARARPPSSAKLQPPAATAISERADAVRELGKLGPGAQPALASALTKLVASSEPLDEAHLVSPAWGPLITALEALQPGNKEARPTLERLAALPVPAAKRRRRSCGASSRYAVAPQCCSPIQSAMLG